MDVNPGAAPFADVPLRAPVIRGDVTRFEDVMRTVLDVKPDRLINLAYGLGAGEGNPHQVMRLDVLGMDNCFEAARLAGVKRVVYASSIAVSGQQSHFGDRLATEDDPTYGTSQYADAQDLQRVPGAASTSRTTACRSRACAPPTSPAPTRSGARRITCRS